MKNDPIPSVPKKITGRKKMVAYRFSDDHIYKLDAIANHEGQTKSNVLRWLVDFYFDSHVKKGKKRKSAA